MILNNEQIAAYLLNEDRRRTINWTGIENQYGIAKGRIKNVLLYNKGVFREDELQPLTKAIQDLQLSDELKEQLKQKDEPNTAPTI